MIERYIEYYKNMLYRTQDHLRYFDNSLAEHELEDSILEVLDLISSEDSIDDIREILSSRSNIRNEFLKLFRDRKIAPCASISYGTKNYSLNMFYGYSKETEQDIKRNFVSRPKKSLEKDIFDLFSTSSLFTYLSILLLEEKGIISFSDSLGDYLKVSDDIKDVTIMSLLTFKTCFETVKPYTLANSKEELWYLLKNANVVSEFVNSDINFLFLKLIIEKVTGYSYSDFIKKEFSDKYNLVDTTCNVDSKNLRLVNTNYDSYYFSDGTLVTNTFYKEGKTHDRLAHFFSNNGNYATGSSGVFSTHSDMKKLFSAILNGKLVKNNNLLNSGTICDNPYFSDFGHYFSDNSIHISDDRGAILNLDPTMGNFSLLTANPTHNRVRYVDPVFEKRIMEDKKGKRSIILPSKEEKIISDSFLTDTKDLMHAVSKLLFQYTVLEDILNKELKQEKKKSKTISL